MTWFSSTEQSVSWFRDRMKDGSLLIKPPYQRKPIWKLEQKCALIESILLDMPIPEIFMQTNVDENGDTVHAIVDGQQRIRTILHFLGIDPTESESEFQNFKLSKLDETSPYYNKTLSTLSKDERESFYAYQFTIRTLRSRDDGKIRDVFQRLNKFQSPMLPQELRNASYAGPFLSLATELADREYWTQNKIITPDKVRRMEDVEYISELLFALMLGPQSGGKEVINDLYATYDSYEDEFPEQVKYKTIFVETIKILEASLPEISKTRWANKSDFYSLFILIGHRLEEKQQVISASDFGVKLHALDSAVAAYQKRKDDPTYTADENIVKYVDAVSRGASEKPRRNIRHAALNHLLNDQFR